MGGARGQGSLCGRYAVSQNNGHPKKGVRRGPSAVCAGGRSPAAPSKRAAASAGHAKQIISPTRDHCSQSGAVWRLRGQRRRPGPRPRQRASPAHARVPGRPALTSRRGSSRTPGMPHTPRNAPTPRGPAATQPPGSMYTYSSAHSRARLLLHPQHCLSATNKWWCSHTPSFSCRQKTPPMRPRSGAPPGTPLHMGEVVQRLRLWRLGQRPSGCARAVLRAARRPNVRRAGGRAVPALPCPGPSWPSHKHRHATKGWCRLPEGLGSEGRSSAPEMQCAPG